MLKKDEIIKELLTTTKFKNDTKNSLSKYSKSLLEKEHEMLFGVLTNIKKPIIKPKVATVCTQPTPFVGNKSYELSLVKLTNEKLTNLHKFASASIIERNNVSYKIHTNDTAVLYLSILSLIKNSIKELSKEEYIILNNKGVVYNTKMYKFNNSDFTSNIEDMINYNFYCNENIKAGTSGNTSISYFSITKDNKLLNKDMFDIINIAKIKVIVSLNDENYIISINNLTDWQILLTDIMNKKYIPIRLFLENVGLPARNMFYLKKINAFLNKTYKSLREDFAKDNGLLIVSSAVLNNTYNFKIGDFLEDISNNNFIIKVDKGELIKIYFPEQALLCLPFISNSIHNYDKDSFIFYRKEMKKFTPMIEYININDYYVSKKGLNVKDSVSLFVRDHQDMIDSKLEKDAKSSRIVYLTNYDETVKKTVTKLKSNFFTKHNSTDNIQNDTLIIKEQKVSNILFKLYPRIYSKTEYLTSKIYSNVDTQMTWFNSINSGLSFEREKMNTLIYLENFLNSLIKEGHTNIEVDLEKPILKKDGNFGFLDVIVTSYLKGEKYGQVFEMKSITNYTANTKQKCIEQAESYDIQRDIIDSYNIKKSYKGFDLLKVALLNLV